MSTHATRWAWTAPVNTCNERCMLLALADRAGDDHTAWPSYDRLAQDTQLDPKTIPIVLARLQAAGHIIDTGERKGPTKRVKVWRLAIPTAEGQPADNPTKNHPIESTQNRNQSASNPPKNGRLNPSKNGRLNTPKNGVLNPSENGVQNLKQNLSKNLKQNPPQKNFEKIQSGIQLTPTQPDPTPEQQAEAHPLIRRLWADLRRCHIDIAITDPRLLQWHHAKQTKHLCQRAIDLHCTNPEAWFSPDQLTARNAA